MAGTMNALMLVQGLGEPMVGDGRLVGRLGISLCVVLGSFCLTAAFDGGVRADQGPSSQGVELAAALPLSGDGTSFGQPTLDVQSDVDLSQRLRAAAKRDAHYAKLLLLIHLRMR